MAEGPQLVGVVWWPHSGGRWFCRSILKKHSQVQETAFTHPWTFFTSDMTLDLDITSQVHKARSLPEWEKELDALKASTDHGRLEGLKKYFEMMKAAYKEEGEKGRPSHVIGEMCLGSPEPRPLDLELLFASCPEFKLIHLVRDPRSNFNSFFTRYEIDGDPVRIAGSWLSLNAGIRKFFEKRPQFRDQYVLVKYEDLMEDPVGTVRSVCENLGLSFEEGMTSDLEERWGKRSNMNKEVPSEVVDTMEELIGDELRRFGYEV